VTALVGWLLTDVLAPNAITRYDDDVAQRLVDSRTPERTDLAHWGAGIANTEIKIIVTAVIALLLIALLRRWHESLFLVATLVVEASAFVVASFIVGRSRPDVPRLLDSPVDSSFPSGHVAAATVYSALIVIVFRTTRSVAARVAIIAVCIPLPFVVGWARMYQGMHFLSDVVAGMLLGVATIALCAWIMPRPEPSSTEGSDDIRGSQQLESTDGGSTLRPVDDTRAQGAADVGEPRDRIEHDATATPTNTST